MTRFLDPLLRRRAAATPAAPTPTTEEKVRLLRSADLFQDLPQADVERIEQMAVMSQCRQGQIVYSPGETREALFLLKRGRIEIYRLSEDGKRLLVSNVQAGMAFGDMALTGQGMHGSYAEAVEDCMICVMSRADVEALVQQYPAVAVRIIRMLSDRITDLEERLDESALRDIPSRVAAALLRAAQQDGPSVRMTHQQLAELVGTHRETVTRTLGEFRDRGMIRLARGHIDLIDMAALEQAAGA